MGLNSRNTRRASKSLGKDVYMENSDCPSWVDKDLPLPRTSARLIPTSVCRDFAQQLRRLCQGCLESLAVPQHSPWAAPASAAPTFLLHANIFPSYSESCLSLNRAHFPTSFVVLQIMGFKEWWNINQFSSLRECVFYVVEVFKEK